MSIHSGLTFDADWRARPPRIAARSWNGMAHSRVSSGLVRRPGVYLIDATKTFAGADR